MNNSDQPQAGRSEKHPDQPALITLAHLLRPQGRAGEILADLFTDLVDPFETGKRVFLANEDFSGLADAARSIEIASYFLPVGRNAGRIVLRFSGINSIEAAETLAGLDVLIPSSELPKLDDEEAYVNDLVGCTLFDCNGDAEPIAVGTVTGVQFATTPNGSRRLEEAAPLLVVQTEVDDEVLIPYAKSLLRSLDTSAKRIEMALPTGLLDINR